MDSKDMRTPTQSNIHLLRKMHTRLSFLLDIAEEIQDPALLMKPYGRIALVATQMGQLAELLEIEVGLNYSISGEDK